MKLHGYIGLTVMLGSIWIAYIPNLQASAQSPIDSGFVLTGCITRNLKITAYYTPEALQGVFFNGDYATEKKINGGNVHGASGIPTYNGMLAGPKQYPFGTTVSIPGVGIGVIHDRGGAIVSSGGTDRIDVWAGYSLQGMVNALNRGTRNVVGEICSGGLVDGPFGFDRTQNPPREKASKQMLWSLNMELGNNGLTVFYLNSFLQQLGYLKAVSSSQGRKPQTKSFWILNNQLSSFTTGTKLALCAFQQDAIGLSGDNQYCGFYGTQTRAKFAQLVKQNKVVISDFIFENKKLKRRTLKIR